MTSNSRSETAGIPGPVPKGSLVERAWALLASPRLPWLAAIAGVLLCAASISTGLQSDDFVQSDSVARGRGLSRCLDLFSYIPRDPDRMQTARNVGMFPWYASDNLQLRFLRPLSSLTHCLDYSAWPRAAWLMHVENIAWFAALVFAVARLYRRALPTAAVAGLATLFFAIDDAHGPVVGWVANRNALLATLFGVLSLTSYLRFRTSGERRHAFAGPLLFAAALLSGEAGIVTLGYLLAHAACVDEAPWRKRLAALSPYFGIAVIWQAAWRVLGYGTRGSAAYVDAFRNPATFIEEAAQRGPVSLLGQLGWPPAGESYLVEQPRARLLVLGAVLALTIVTAIYAPLLARRRNFRFWALATVLSLVASCAAPPSDRLLLFTGVGAMALVAELIDVALHPMRGDAPRTMWWRVPASLLAVVFAILHGVVAPIWLPVRAREVAHAGDAIRAGTEDIFSDTARGDKIVIVRGPGMFPCTFSVGLGYMPPGPTRGQAFCLSGGPTPLLVRRPDEHTLVLRPAGGFMDVGLNRMHWDRERPMQDGDHLTVAGVDIAIREVTERGEPLEVAFTFPEPLETYATHWLVWQRDRYRPFSLPAVGDEIIVPRAAKK